MSRKRLALVIAAVMVMVVAVAAVIIMMGGRTASTWTGEWNAIWGYHEGSIDDVQTQMFLSQDDEGNVTGTYSYARFEGTVTGVVDGRRFHGTWAQGNLTGSFELTMARDGESFTGVWSQRGEEAGYWDGTRYSELEGRPH